MRRLALPRAVRDLIVVGLAIAVIATFALWRMGYLSPATAHQIRMTDNSRSAYVAKNLADGHGYTTNDLPAALLDFYHREGRLDDARWENADRFPFTAYAIAGLYKLTGSTSYVVGITLYNAITFVGYLLLVFALGRAIWGERRAALLAVALALAHPYTYRFLYFKDADSQLLATATFLALHYFVQRPAHEASRRLQLLLGTLLGWTFLARPNVGAAFVLVLAFLGLRQVWRDRGAGARRALVGLARGYGLAAATMILWCLPFAIDSMREWGTPFFSANNIYQLPLGTRFGMGTDTWWKYSEPGHTLTLGEMWRLAPDDMRAKLTTSWLETAKATFRMYGGELMLTLIVAVAGLRSGRTPDAPTAASPPPGATMRALLGTAGFAVLFNLAALPLYAYQRFSFVHYLAFALPVVWVAAGHALSQLLGKAVELWPDATAHVRQRLPLYAAGALFGVVAWSLGSRASMVDPWLIEPGRFAARHWLLSLCAVAVAVGYRWLWRPLTFERATVLMVVVVLARWRGDGEIRLGRRVFFPLTDRAATTLRERTGLVSSFALQSEVAWTSGRRNIPAPEYALHLYSYRFEHGLAIEDVYLESAEAMVHPGLGPFARAAPGFETYARLQRYGGTLPGYQRVLHVDGSLTIGGLTTGKASSVYRLVDPAAADRMAQTSTRIDLGALDAIVYAAYGFGDYTQVDGRAAVVTTDAIARRYWKTPEVPSESVGVTYVVGDRAPRAVDIEIYATGPGTARVYQNVDLFEYTPRRQLEAHRVATISLAAGGWQTVRVELRPGGTRRGVNKLGFAVDAVYPTILCPRTTADGACLSTPRQPLPDGHDDTAAPRLVRTDDGGPPRAVRSAFLLGALTFVE